MRAPPCSPGTCFPTGPGHGSAGGNVFLHVGVCFPMQTAPRWQALRGLPLPQA